MFFETLKGIMKVYMTIQIDAICRCVIQMIKQRNVEWQKIEQRREFIGRGVDNRGTHGLRAFKWLCIWNCLHNHSSSLQNCIRLWATSRTTTWPHTNLLPQLASISFHITNRPLFLTISFIFLGFSLCQWRRCITSSFNRWKLVAIAL